MSQGLHDPLPPAILSRNPVRWLGIFGPGAIIASLTIGTGELVFSSRGGAIFGYSVLWIFLAISILKWVLVFATARHMVLSGAHPFERGMSLPGPAGWLPLLFLLPAVPCFPVWVGFHSGVIGTLVADVTGGLVDKHIGGFVALATVLVLVALGGYSRLERIQIGVVSLMLVCVAMSALLMEPDWLEVLGGLLVPRPLHYPDWLAGAAPDIARTPVWIEGMTYVGVIGGASYDYLAYVSFLREKRWGLSGSGPATNDVLEGIARDAHHPVRRWVRAPLIDCTVSFAVVILFSAVFVISGHLVLGPAHTVPRADNLLNLQESFVTRLHPWLYSLYIAGAFLTMAGTLYGTIEVAPAVLGEAVRALRPSLVVTRRSALRIAAVSWCGAGAVAVLAWSWVLHGSDGAGSAPPTLIEIVRPANIFTGVFSCAFVCFMVPWMDRRFLPRSLRAGPVLVTLQFLAGAVFLGAGLKAFWDYGEHVLDGALLLLLVAGILPAAWGIALGLSQFIESRPDRR